MWLACYTIQKGARKWQRYHANIRGGIKTASFSGTTDASGNINLTTDPSRVIIGANDTGGNCYTFWKPDANRTLAKVYTTSNGYLAVRTNIAVSGTYIYIDNDSF